MGTFRKNLSGTMAFHSYVPIPLQDICIIHTPAIDKLIVEVENAMHEFNLYMKQLSEEQTLQLMEREAEASCKLALGIRPSIFEFVTDTNNNNNDLKEDTVNLLKATGYAWEALRELPLSARLLKNAHYLMCGSVRYAKKYAGDFRHSPVWIGEKGSDLRTALFIPPVDEDMLKAISDLEHYIHEDSPENIFVRAALIHYQFEMIHPFIDGNGRVGRLLNLLYLCEQGILNKPILPISDELHKRAFMYYMQLQYVNSSGSYEDWVKFFLEVLKTAASLNMDGSKLS